MKQFIRVALCILWVATNLSSQSADKTDGCIPLTVSFTSPNTTSHFWDFADGNSSELQNPEHVFTTAGSYTVGLYHDSSKATKIGEVTIQVYPDLLVDISASATVGCDPSTIDFTSSIIKDNAIKIESYIWAFGDGSSSTLQNTSHTFSGLGLYDVSLALKTSIDGCDKTILKEDYITIAEHEAAFDVDKRSSCTAPLDVTITNQSEQLEGYTYAWQFGDFSTSDDYNPGTISFTELGSHYIKLTMTAPDGCVDIVSRTINIGVPQLSLIMEDTICAGVTVPIYNSSTGTGHTWDFGSDATPSTSSSRLPRVTYDSPGFKTVTYTSRANGCSSDTTFTVLVDADLSSFSVSPQTICGDSVIMHLTAEHKNIGTYYWNDSDSTATADTFYVHKNPIRDSFYVNQPEEFTFSLKVKSTLGCIDSSEVSFEAQLPEAFFIPDSVIGIAPLTLGFKNASSSSEPIVKRLWDFGDGNVLEGPDYITHTYTEPGKYYVKLRVDNEQGCHDYSTGTIITVLKKLTIKDIENDNNDTDEIDITLGGGSCINGNPLCVGDQVSYTLPYSDAYDVHLDTDAYRFDHCWTQNYGVHTFNHPGTYYAMASLEIEGFEMDYDTLGLITIQGARAEIGYSKECAEPYRVKLWSRKEGAAQTVWYHDNLEISEAEEFTHTFSSLGEKEIILEVQSDNPECAVHRDTAYIYITEPKSTFELEGLFCEGQEYLIDASTAEYTGGCGAAYNWEFEAQRSRSVMDPLLNHAFISGHQNVSLTVTDINGCTDQHEQKIQVLGTTISFPLDTSICFPHDHIFENQTSSDTTIVSYEWSFGSQEESPAYAFTTEDLEVDSLGQVSDSLWVMLKTKDAYGCIDSLEIASRIYKPVTDISITDRTICQGNKTIIKADDFTEEGKRLLYEWDFASGGTSTDQSNEVHFTEAGTQNIQLIFTEEGTQCSGTRIDSVKVYKQPQASFRTNVDGLASICYPYTVEFENTSVVDGNIDYEWDFGNGSISDLIDPAVSYDRGTYTASLTAKSAHGCEDIQDITFNLIGPDGDLIIDRDNICLGEDIHVSLDNAVDVVDYTWDMGDGSIIHNQNAINYAYAYKPPGETTDIDLILRSGDDGCEVIKTITVNINEVIADFEIDQTKDWCSGLIGFKNLSVGQTISEWEFGDGETDTDANPIHVYTKEDQYQVTLRVEDELSGCTSTFSQDVDVSLAPNDFYGFANTFTPNADGRNDLFRPVVPENYKDVVTINTFQIYDRRGQLIYDNEDPEGWDGTRNGRPLAEEVYAFFIEMEIQDCKVVQEKGNVTLVR